MKKTTDNNTNIKIQEEMIEKALREGGFLFPETPEEVAEFEKKFGSTDVILPEDLRQAPHPKKNRVVKLNKQEKQQNLAMAAREGSQLPEEIQKKMKEDREKAKKAKKK
jgi:hypothetical protein